MPKIMLIEDDSTMLSLLTTLLGMEGFTVSAVGDDKKENIIKIIHQELPDVLLTDVNLRQCNGLDLVTSLRQDSELKNIHILMTSGLNLNTECKQAGADEFIQKPYMPDDLIGLIRKVLQN